MSAGRIARHEELTSGVTSASWDKRLFIEPPKPDPRGGIKSSRISHVNTQGSITPAEARDLARVLLELAEDCERLDAQALPHLDAYLAAVESFDRDRSP